MEALRSDLGAVLRSEREASGLSRAELAAHAGLSTNTLMAIEQGRTQDPGIFKVAALCRALSTAIDAVIERVTLERGRGAPAARGIVSIGYEGRTIEEFVRVLVDQGVETVVDVRLTPLSRKPGFSKTKLSDALAAAGIEYRHLRVLGNQKENRAPFREGRIDAGREAFRAAIDNPVAEKAIEDLSSLIEDRVVAILCFEADQHLCHRHVVIDEVTRGKDVLVVQI